MEGNKKSRLGGNCSFEAQMGGNFFSGAGGTARLLPVKQEASIYLEVLFCF